jgi:hypothetical protein
VPLATRLLLVLAVVALGAALFMTSTGGLARVVSAVSTRVDGMVAGLTATPTPRPTVLLAAEAPGIAKPDEPYTNQPHVDVVVGLPPDVVGSRSVVRLRVKLPDASPTVVQEVPVGATASLVIPGVPLTAGRNDFTATIDGPGGESEPSPVVTYVLDVEPPALVLTAPVDGQTINGGMVAVSGMTQGRAAVAARNDSTGASVTAEAAADGAFSLEVPLGKGANPITLTATDPAGNVATLPLTILRGEGKLTAKLTTDPAGVDTSHLPQPMKLEVLVKDPDDKPLEAAKVTFTLSVPGIQVVTSEAVTAADGTAVFETTVPQGATPGEGVAAVLVRTEAHGEVTASVELKLAE